jgi:iron complex transport system ATP-binding protein
MMTFEQVRYGYRRGAAVLDGVNLTVRTGSLTSILGPNGVGKTTLLFLALGWLRPWAGEVRLLGRPLTQLSRRTLGQSMALVPQSEHVPFEYSVLEYVLLGRAAHLPVLGMPGTADVAAARDALAMIGLAEFFDRSMLALSGGERQLVLVARALVQQPHLLLLDEPTAHLDLGNQYRLAQILRQLHQNGTTILMTTHDPDFALALSDEMILMGREGVLEAGPTQTVATEENLMRVYGVPVRIRLVDGQRKVMWL